MSLSDYDYKVALYFNASADPLYQFNIYNTGDNTYVTMYVRRFTSSDDQYRTHTMLNNFVLYWVVYEGENYYALKLQNQENYELCILGANLSMEPLLLTEGVEEFKLSLFQPSLPFINFDARSLCAPDRHLETSSRNQGELRGNQEGTSSADGQPPDSGLPASDSLGAVLGPELCWGH